MNKTQLVAAVSDKTGHSKKDVAAVLDGITDAIRGELATGGEVAVQFFGSFKRTYRPARDGRNPQTGEPIRIAESWKVTFSPAGALKDAANGEQSPVSAVA